MTEFIGRTKDLTEQDLTVPVKIYNSIAGRVFTDITVDEVVYLAAVAREYHFDAGQIITIPGESIRGEENEGNGYDEFYADEKALYEMILDIFYEPIG